MDGTEEHFSLCFDGFETQTPDNLQRFKAICIADLELSIESTIQLLSGEPETRVLKTAESMDTLEPLYQTLCSLGAKVAIVTPLGERLSPEPPLADDAFSTEDVTEEITFELDEILKAPSTDPKKNASGGDAPLKEYTLDLNDTTSLGELGLDSDLGLSFSEPTHSVVLKVPDNAATNSSLSFLEEDAEDLPDSNDGEASSVDSLVFSVAQTSEAMDTSDEFLLDFDLGPAPTQLDLLDMPASLPSTLLEDDLVLTPMPESDLDNELSMTPVVAAKAPTPKEAVAPSASRIDTRSAHFEIPKMEQALSLSIEDKPTAVPPIPPEPPRQAKVTVAREVTATSSNVLALDGASQRENAASEAPPMPKPNAAPAGLVGATTPVQPVVAPLRSPSASAPQDEQQGVLPLAQQRARPAAASAVEASEEEEEAATTESWRPGKRGPTRRSDDREGLSKGQLTAVISVGIALLLAANWFLQPSSTQQPSVLSGLPNVAAGKKADSKRAEKSAIIDIRLVGDLTNEQSTASAAIRVFGERVTGRISFSTPKPPELTAEQVGRGEAALPWLKKAETDEVLLSPKGEGTWGATVPMYVYVERGNDRRRVLATADITVALSTGKDTGAVKFKAAYSPVGDTGTIPEGAFITPVSNTTYRIGFATEFELKK